MAGSRATCLNSRTICRNKKEGNEGREREIAWARRIIDCLSLLSLSGFKRAHEKKEHYGVEGVGLDEVMRLLHVPNEGVRSTKSDCTYMFNYNFAKVRISTFV